MLAQTVNGCIGRPQDAVTRTLEKKCRRKANETSVRKREKRRCLRRARERDVPDYNGAPELERARTRSRTRQSREPRSRLRVRAVCFVRIRVRAVDLPTTPKATRAARERRILATAIIPRATRTRGWHSTGARSPNARLYAPEAARQCLFFGLSRPRLLAQWRGVPVLVVPPAVVVVWRVFGCTWDG